jgi:hypothetical protein
MPKYNDVTSAQTIEYPAQELDSTPGLVCQSCGDTMKHSRTIPEAWSTAAVAGFGLPFLQGGCGCAIQKEGLGIGFEGSQGLGIPCRWPRTDTDIDEWCADAAVLTAARLFSKKRRIAWWYIRWCIRRGRVLLTTQLVGAARVAKCLEFARPMMRRTHRLRYQLDKAEASRRIP